ncbi:hypothetical protein MJO04_24080, partial [Salmonella enterica subsp. enterica serovar Anatum]|nr:hypothetical protein [Salmonella enterica subsp. enterica serovar Anatum]
EKEDRLITNKNSGIIDESQSSVSWRFEEDGTLFLSGGHLNGAQNSTTFRLSQKIDNNIVPKVSTIIIEDTIILNTGIDYFFSDFINLKEIKNFSNLNGTNVNTARFLFTNTPQLTHIDWSNQTLLFPKMGYMFAGSQIELVNLDNLNLPITTSLEN